MYKDGNHIKHLLDHNYGKPEINQKKNWRKPKKKKNHEHEWATEKKYQRRNFRNTQKQMKMEPQ